MIGIILFAITAIFFIVLFVYLERRHLIKLKLKYAENLSYMRRIRNWRIVNLILRMINIIFFIVALPLPTFGLTGVPSAVYNLGIYIIYIYFISVLICVTGSYFIEKSGHFKLSTLFLILPFLLLTIGLCFMAMNWGWVYCIFPETMCKSRGLFG